MPNMNVPVDEDLYARFKALAKERRLTISDLVHELMEEYVERMEEAALDEMFKKRLARAMAGKPIGPMPHLDKYYKAIKKAQKKSGGR